LACAARGRRGACAVPCPGRCACDTHRFLGIRGAARALSQRTLINSFFSFFPTQAPAAYHQQPSSTASASAAAAAAAALGAALGGGGSAANPSDPYQFAAGLAVDALRAGGGAGGVFERGAALFKGGWLGALTRGGSGGGGGASGDGTGGSMMGGGGPSAANHAGHSGAPGGGRFSLFGLGTSLHVTSPYVRSKLALLMIPWARRWTYTRIREAGAVVSSGQNAPPPPYAPPARDVHAPDLYLPLMASLTLALLRGVSAVAAGAFTPETLASAVSGAFSLWALHAGVLKGALWSLGAAGAAPLAEVLAYAGYPAVHGACACAVRAASDWRAIQGRGASAPGGSLASMAAGAAGAAAGAEGGQPSPPTSAGAVAAAGGGWAPALVTAYGATAAGVFLVRSLKRVLFQDARRGGGGGGGGNGSPPARTNYVLLLVWALQWPLVWWMARGCRIPVPK